MSVVTYVDCVAVTCDGPDCQRELYVGHVVPTEFEDSKHHFCSTDCEWAYIDRQESATRIVLDVLHLLTIDNSRAVHEFARQAGIISDSADYLLDDGRLSTGSRDGLEDPSTSAAE